ncbi:YfcE family phosphodiesterase [Candidatus Falkowbacteria bacterium]|nr:YfcE family phosphodiesterase [Candidatus Falkowbacteria bacterium]
MKIGIISDTHNKKDLIKKALQVFKHEKVGMIIHAGDMDTAEMLFNFNDLGVPLRMAIGNVDEEPERFGEKARELGIDFEINTFLKLEVNGKRIFVFHGNVLGEREKVLNTMIQSGLYDVIIYGHSHKQSLSTRRLSTSLETPRSLRPSSGSSTRSPRPLDFARGRSEDGVLIFNPGSLEPLVAGVKPSVIIYNTETGEAKFVELD